MTASDASLAARHLRAAGLRHVSDSAPGIRRERRGRGLVYVDAQGRRLRGAVRLLRRVERRGAGEPPPA